MSSAAVVLGAEELGAIADGIAAGNPAAYVPAGADRRWGIVVATEVYEAWVIAWPNGTGLAMHDHGGARAAVRIVSGRLRERFHADGEVQLRWLDAGHVHVLPANHVHEVINLNDIEAISVHVYSPPVGDMGFRVDPEIDLRTHRRRRTAEPRLRLGGGGYRSAMTDHPHQASSDEADPETQSTPAGVVGDLEEEAEEAGATTEPSPTNK